MCSPICWRRRGRLGCFPSSGQPVTLPTILIRKPFTGRVPSIGYPGAKSGLAKTILRFMPQFGRIFVDACAGKGNVFWAAAKFLKFEEWWINDLQTAPFFEAMREIGDSIIVPEFTSEEFDRYKAAFEQGSREARLLEPYLTYSGCGFEHSGQKGSREHPTKPAGYQRTLRSCHGILHKTNARITGMNFKDMHLEELGSEDFVYFDAPYWSGNVKTYSPDTVDFPYLFRLLEKANFRWLLSEYPEPIYFEHFGDPCFVQDVKLLCTRLGDPQVRTECLWKGNY
jgi:site-specific DNA-adenine methylase